MERQQRRGRVIAMNAEELTSFLGEQHTCRFATTGPGGPHVAPVWFVWDGQAIWVYSLIRSQRWANVSRDPRVAVVVDDGHHYHELHGVEIEGQATVIGPVPRTGDEDSPELAEPERLMSAKYFGAEMTHDGRHAWLRITPQKIVSWDFRKLATLPAKVIRDHRRLLAPFPGKPFAIMKKRIEHQGPRTGPVPGPEQTGEHMSDEVLVERRGAVQVIVINRPEARNALNRAVAVGIRDAVDELDATAELRAGVLTGAGDTFSSGMDLKAFLAGEVPSFPGRGLCGITQTPPRKPLVGAAEGWALAGGFELLLACDLVVAGASARFGVPEVKRGLLAGAGGAMLLAQRIPRALALEMLLTGDPFDAARAAEIGLVNHVVRRRPGPAQRRSNWPNGSRPTGPWR